VDRRDVNDWEAGRERVPQDIPIKWAVVLRKKFGRCPVGLDGWGSSPRQARQVAAGRRSPTTQIASGFVDEAVSGCAAGTQSAEPIISS